MILPPYPHEIGRGNDLERRELQLSAAEISQVPRDEIATLTDYRKLNQDIVVLVSKIRPEQEARLEFL
jgi:hypothetical protein